MVLDVRRYPDPVLLRMSDPVTDFDQALARLVEDMFETMYVSQGVGLAAPQVGINKRIFVVNCEFEDKGAEGEIALINPEIIETHNLQVGTEGCLSFPGVYADVERAERVRVRYQSVSGEWQEKTGEGLLARAFQHELDHLNGKVFVDYLRPEQLVSVGKEIEELKRDFKRRQQSNRG